jgi:hypothetical protein
MFQPKLDESGKNFCNICHPCFTVRYAWF